MVKENDDSNIPPQNSHASSDLSQILSSSIEQKMSKWFLRFAEQTKGSPMYQHLSTKISEDQELLSLAANSDASQPVPNLFLAAIHFLLMRNPEEPLAKFYPSVGGHFEPSAELFQCLKSFCTKFNFEIELLLKTRLVQTNEVQRCALLLPALSFISKMENQSTIALIDFGCAGGLNLLMDKAHIEYSDGTSVGPADSEIQLRCESKGYKLPVFNKVEIKNRIGIDLNPVNLLDESERQWNLALIWPDQIERFERMRSALKILEKTQMKFKKGSGNQVLASVLTSDVPANQTVCIMHSFVLNQFTEEDRNKFDSLLIDLSQSRTIWRVSVEWIGSKEPELLVICYASGTKVLVQKLADCHGHGDWIRWSIDSK